MSGLEGASRPQPRPRAAGCRAAATYLAYRRDDGRYVIFASKGGSPTHPAWYHNLKAHPEVTIEVGAETVDVTAAEATGEERDP